jgi:hypothetical protein
MRALAGLLVPGYFIHIILDEKPLATVAGWVVEKDPGRAARIVASL